MSEKTVTRRIKKKGRLEMRTIRNMLIIFLIIMISTSVAILSDSLGEALEEKKQNLKSYVELSMNCLRRQENTDFTEILTTEEYIDYLDNLSTYGENVDNWLENGADNDYEMARDSLNNFKDYFSLNDIYVYKATRDENGVLQNDMVIVFDSSDDDEGTEYELGEDFGPSQVFDTIKKIYETGESEALNRMAFNGKDLVIAAFAPVKYSDGTVCAILGAEMRVSTIFIDVLTDNYVLLLDAAMNFLIFAFIIFMFIKRSVVKPVKIISQHMNKFVSNEGMLEFAPITEIQTRDEIEQIADDFNALAQRTIDYTKNLEQKTTEEERLRIDLDVASQIRSVISSEPTYPPFPERTDFDLCASLNYTMYNRCSFCNYFFTDTDHLFIVAGEPLGDSLASMIFSVLSVSYIKSFAKLGFEPYKIAMETNNELCSIEKTDAGLTVGVIIIDVELKTGVMKYINAGMPPMLIKKPGENYTADKPDKPFSLGQMRGVSFEQNTVQLYQGSTVMLTSFGVTGMSDANGRKYGFDRLTNVMNRISGNVYDLDKTVKQLEKDIDDFRDGSPVSRDTMILGFRYYG